MRRKAKALKTTVSPELRSPQRQCWLPTQALSTTELGSGSQQTGGHPVTS